MVPAVRSEFGAANTDSHSCLLLPLQSDTWVLSACMDSYAVTEL